MIAARGSPGVCHSGTDAGWSRASRPSATNMPITAWSIDLAIDHDSSGVSGVTGLPGLSHWGRRPS